MKFQYLAVDSKNRKQKGYVNGESRRDALVVLKKSGLKVINLEIKRDSSLKLAINKIFERVTPKDFVIFSRQLAILIDSNVPIIQAIRAIATQTDNNLLSSVLQQVLADIEGGSSISEAMEKHPQIFSKFYVNMVKSGELSGNLQKTLNDLADNIEKNYDLTSKLKSAMYYPGFIFSAMVVVAFLMMTFVIPKLLEILKENEDIVLPLQTRILIWTSDFSKDYWWAILIAMAGIIFGISYYLKTEDGKREFDYWILRVPVINKILEYIYIARFSENLTSLLKSGLTINVALNITADIIGNEIYKEAIKNTVHRVKKGDKIAESLDQYNLFPPIVIQMIEVGESTGRIDYSLAKITEFYTKEADTMIKNFSSLIEPVIMVILAIGVGILVSAILLPIYQVSQSIK
jgi:type IV pilus assembly protein PilC